MDKINKQNKYYLRKLLLKTTTKQIKERKGSGSKKQ